MSDTTAARLDHWLARLRGGDPAARNELLRHSEDRLRALAHRMLNRDFPRLRRWVDTSDVFQNASIRLDRALKAVAPAAPADLIRLGATQIRRELLDLCGHYFGPQGPAPHHHTPPADAGPADLADPTDDPRRLAEWRELHEYIAALPDADRALFDLLLYQGLTQAAAAELSGVPLRTLRRRWQAARLRLMERFGHVTAF